MELRYTLGAFFVMNCSIHLSRWSMESRFLEMQDTEDRVGEEGEEDIVEEDGAARNNMIREWASVIFEWVHVNICN